METLSELTHGLITNRQQHSDSLQQIAAAQSKLNEKIAETKKEEDKPLMLVVPGLGHV